jgi:hypothetical protein
VEQRIEANLRETLDLNTREIQESVQAPNPVEPEGEESFPMPEEPQESSSPQWETGEAVGMKIYRIVKFWTEQVEWETRPRPEWWSPAWEELAETRNADSPKEFKECIMDDVFALDVSTMQIRTDESTGEIVDASIDPELINVASAVVWNPRGATMVRKCDRGQDLNDLVLSLFREVLQLVPDNRSLTYVTSSEWLCEQWSDMLAWQAVGYQGLDRGACPYQWKGIMEHVEARLEKVTMVRSGDSDIAERIRNAATMYGREGVDWYRDLLATPVGGDYPPTAPLS